MSTFYLDMDGVVADWDTAAMAYIGNTHWQDPELGGYSLTADQWNKLAQYTRFYRNLPIMPRSVELVTLARRYRDELGWDLLFLTAVSHLNDVPWAYNDKVLWAQDTWHDIPVHFGPHASDKWRHCRPGDILVDDRADNCAQWQQAGGVSFHVRGNDLNTVLPAINADFNQRRTRHSLDSYEEDYGI